MHKEKYTQLEKKYTQLGENAKIYVNCLFLGSYLDLTTSDKADIYATGCVN